MKVMLIINPRAGKMKSKTALYDIVETFCNEGYDVTVKITTAKNDAAFFAEKAAKEGFDKVICCGGDGTLNETISGIIASGKNVPIGYIPSGSTNDFARTLGLPASHKKAAERIIRDELKEFDIGFFDKSRYFSYIASFGIFTAASYTTSQNTKNVLGHFAYVLEGIRDIGVVKPYNIKAVTDDKVYEGEYIFGAVTNSTSVGGIVKLQDELVDLNDGKFEVVLVKMPKDIAEFSRVIVGLTNSDLTDDMFDFFKCDKITFESKEQFSWSLDGEEATPDKKVEIENIKSAIKLYI